MVIFLPQFFGHLSCGQQKRLGVPGLWVWCAQHAHTINENSSQLDQPLRSYRASKSKKSNFSLFSKSEKNRFLQVTKVDLSLQCGKILRPNLSHRHLTKMHCCHLNIFGKFHLFRENGEVKVRPWLVRVPKILNP